MTDWITAHWGETAALVVGTLLTLIQLSPLKVNPWSVIGRGIGRFIGVEDVRKSLDKHVSMDDERYAKQCRMRILRFNDELLQNIRHTKEHFDEILDDITEYERYCETHPGYRNSKANMAIETVEKTYQRCSAEKSFL